MNRYGTINVAGLLDKDSGSGGNVHMKFMLFAIILGFTSLRVMRFVPVKGAWVNYSLFCIVASILLAVLQLNINGHYGNLNHYIISASPIFVGYLVLFIFYPIIRNKINSLS